MDSPSPIWLSYSRISLFQKCPRAYYITYLYRDPRNNRKVSLITPHLALGSAVHSVLESLSTLPVATRLKTSLVERFETAWERVSGKKGGFASEGEESTFKKKGQAMLRRVIEHPGPLLKKAVKINSELPSYWLCEKDGLKLCGRLDWLEYLEDQDAVRIIDFKTGSTEESVSSLQLPIYYLLASNCQPRKVAGASYWYIARDDYPSPQALPDPLQSSELVLKAGKEIRLATSLERFKCKTGGCKTCRPLEKILSGEAEYVGEGEFNTDLYALFNSGESVTSQIL